ncbi:MAG: hypothetical protein KC416_09010 [Myxococcales bacterium]|nr:hypothetical protein [Myxococcales bacterium]
MMNRSWLFLWVLIAACTGSEGAESSAGAKGAPPAAGPVDRMGAGPSKKPSEGQAPVDNTDKPAEPAEVGPLVRTAQYELRLTQGNETRQGELGAFSLTVEPQGKWHMNLEYPTTVALEAPSSLGLPKAQLERGDAARFDETGARFDVPFTPSDAGEHRVVAKVSFAVCTEQTCVPDEQTVALALLIGPKGP